MTIGLRALLAAAFGAIGLAFTLGTAVLLQAEAGDRMQRLIGGNLHELAFQVASRLDAGMYERFRDLLVVSALDGVRSPDASADARRAVLERLQGSFPDYAWIGFITPGGAVQAATGRVAEGMDANQRPWWKQALERGYVGDVHDAIVLGRILYKDRPEPPRFVDLAAPVRASDGTLAGVVAAHLSWDWATHVERAVLEAVDEARRVEALILAADGTVLLGSRELMGKTLPGLPGGRVWAVHRWPDGRDYLTSVAPTRGHMDYPGLGWTVVVREPLDLATAPVRDLQRCVLLWGAGASALAVAVGLLLAGWIAAPLRRMASAVRGGGTAWEVGHGYAEIRTLAGALGRYVSDLLAAEGRLKGALAEKETLLREVHHRVKNNLQVVLGLMQMEGSRLPKGDPGRERIIALTRRIGAMANIHEQLYASDAVAAVDMAVQLEQLGLALSDLKPNDAVRIRVDAERILCDLDTAVPVGLLVNELVSNALKHAFPDGRGGTVAVTLRGGPDGGFVLTVADDGIGCQGSVPAGGIGSRLVQALAGQVRGALAFETRTGCTATLTVAAGQPPRSDASPRFSALSSSSSK